jgi:23S rRNA (cytosine1962-C5)-methyltransferase
MAGLVIRPRARILHGHDWVYGGEVLKAFGNPIPGSVISLKDGRDRMLGSAIYNPKSQIIARRFSRRRQDLDHEFFVRRIQQAIELRRRFSCFADCCRVVWSESDGLPGVIIDRYDSHIVLQTLTLGMDQRKELIARAIERTLSPRSIIERNDVPVRRAEGLELVTGVIQGEAPAEVEIAIDGVVFKLDLLKGQKTGFYLDQVDNYGQVAKFSVGLDVLDCFANQGAFALACARAGARSVTAVEISSSLTEGIRANSARNDLPITVVQNNVFDYLTELEKQSRQFDLIILDPPSFARSKETLDSAWRGYKEIHLRALRLLAPQGFLATFSCSHHVTRAMFLEMLVEASVDAKRFCRVIRSLSQPLDHPIIPHLPETEYLKGFILQTMLGR